MSKGISKMQVTVLALLRGTEPLQVCHSGDCEGGMTTDQLLVELEDRGMIDGSRPWRQLQLTMRRSCHSLDQRGLVEGFYVLNDSRRRTIRWKAASSPEPS